MTPIRRHTLGALLVIFALTLLFFYRLAFTDLILGRGDTYAYFYPYWGARDAALAEFTLPLWTGDLFMGAPLLANSQLGTLYPPNWLTIPLDPPDAVRISILLHIAWATLGALILARRTLGLDLIPALIAGVTFGLGGHLGAHVEQINQIQGLSWTPWLFTLFALARLNPWRYLPLMALAWALQVLSGHTQTAFITGVGLGLFALVDSLSATPRTSNLRDRARQAAVKIVPSVGLLALAATLAIIAALPQLWPTQELISISNRGGGLTQQEATAFSLPIDLLGRGLMPGYAGQPFSEYVGYVGVIGIGLAVIGGAASDKRKLPWIALAVAGVVFALGRFTPVYLTLSVLPGFNLFRVPARWLALAAIGAAMLAGLGAQRLLSRSQPVNRRTLAIFAALAGGLALLSLLSGGAADEVDGPATPDLMTWLGWAVAAGAFIRLIYLTRAPDRAWVGPTLTAALALELWLAAMALPFNDLTDPAIHDDARFTINQMLVYGEKQRPPGRLLSISGLLFDPGDKTSLEARWDRMGLSDRAARYAFTAVKMQETLGSNLPLQWGVPTVDGFDGGVLPTGYYTAFTSLMLPEGSLRTVDGRLRENLALPACRGACIPDDRWLDLTNTQYLLTDKVFDLTRDGLFYDTALETRLAPGETMTMDNPRSFAATGINILFARDESCVSCDPMATFDGLPLVALHESAQVDQFELVQFRAPDVSVPEAIVVSGEGPVTIIAMTLIDSRTGDFLQITPPGWRRVLSSDIKIYENMDVMPRAFVVHNAIPAPDTYEGTEEALEIMRDPIFDPRWTVVINSDHPALPLQQTGGPDPGDSIVDIVRYESTRIDIRVDAAAPGYLVLTDAFYPGWTVNGDREIFRANVMFRAIPVERGEQMLTLRYEPAALPFLPLAPALLLLVWIGALISPWRRRAAAVSDTTDS